MITFSLCNIKNIAGEEIDWENIDEIVSSYKNFRPSYLRFLTKDDIVVTLYSEAIEPVNVDNLPPVKDGITYIVTKDVALAAKSLGREDFVIPTEFVRDEYGHVMGCRGFAHV